MLSVRVIVNPKAGGGAGARAAPALKRAFERHGAAAELLETKAPGDAKRLARSCFGGHVNLVAVVGGDGTLNDVSQAYLDPEGRPLGGPPLALVPFGTGGDFRRTLGVVETKLDTLVELIVKNEPRPVDLGVLELVGHRGEPAVKAFVNIASFGLGGLTDRIVNDGPKWLGGKAAFYLGTVRGLVAYKNAPVRVSIDGKVWLEGPIVNVAIANGRYFGGGMMVAPDASVDDGALDVVAIGDLTRLAVVGLTSHIYRGTHIGRPGIEQARGEVIEAVPLAPQGNVLVDLDGETPGRLPVRARVAHHALWFRN